MEKKYNMRGLNILVTSDEESNFVLRLAKAAGYSWRSTENSGGRKIAALSKTIYKRGKWPNGEFVYCFDYNLNPDLDSGTEGELSCFSYDSDFSALQGVMLEYGLKVTEASELMSMDRDALELFLNVR
jgi:hypothetical protein